MPRIGHRPMYGLMPMLGAKQVAGAASYTEAGVEFDGTRYYTRGSDLTDMADGQEGSFIARINLSGSTDGAEYYLFANASVKFGVYRSTSNKIQIVGRREADATNMLNIRTSASHVAASGWLTILASWDVSTGDSSKSQLYVNGSSDLVAVTNLATNPIDYTRTNWSLGATTTGGGVFDACVSCIAFNDVWRDWSSSANRNAVHDAVTFALQDPGTEGTNWFGEKPLVCVVDDYTTYPTNRGDGGAFSLAAGTSTVSCS